MYYKVNEILEQKISEIESRLPVRIRRQEKNLSFEQVLSSTIDNIGKKSTNNVAAGTSSITPGMKNSNYTQTNKKINFSFEYNDSLMRRINRSIIDSAEKYNINPELIRAVIKQESNFNPYAVSKAGAQGLMQLMPETASLLGVNDPWDIEANIDGGTRYLKGLLQTFSGDIKLALAAYNAGPNAVKKYNGIPPYEETKNYVEKVLEYYEKYTK